jgi:ABC-type polysaccharide/polyol phosphate transport system ATPase subunit
MSSAVLRVHNLRYSYPLRPDFLLEVPEWEISPGDSVGIVGGNGSGKTTFLSLLAGVLEPDQGEIYASSRITPLLGVGSSVNEYLTGYENIIAELQAHLGRPPVDEEIKLSAAFTELSNAVLNVSMHTYSSGMKARVAFAPLCAIQPGILVMDEVLAVGDNKFVPKALAVVEHMIANGNALVLASHSSQVIRTNCSKAIWMRDGSIFSSGTAQEVMDKYDDWCREQSLQMLVRSEGDLQPSPGKQVVQISEEIRDAGFARLIIKLDPSGFNNRAQKAQLKISTEESYLLFADECTFTGKDCTTFSVNLCRVGAISLLVEAVFYAGSQQHMSLTLYPRPHGIVHAGGQPIFVPSLNVV